MKSSLQEFIAWHLGKEGGGNLRAAFSELFVSEGCEQS